MAAKMLDDVLSKEKQTALNEEAATEKANEITENAKKQAQSVIEKAQADALVQEKARIEEATRSSEAAVANAADEAKKYAIMLEEKASSKFSEAVGIVRAIITD